MLKKILVVLVLLLLGLTVVGFVAPSMLTVERSITIAAPPAAVHQVLADLKTWPEWSAWTQQRDPSATWEFSGADSGVGAVWSWKGDPKGLGVGRLEITASDPQDGIAYDLAFDEGAMQAPGALRLLSSGGGTHVTWTSQFSMGPKPIGGLMKLFLGGMIGNSVGADFDAGLAGLKQRLETGAPVEPTREG